MLPSLRLEHAERPGVIGRGTCRLLCLVAVIVLGATPVHAQNLLVNPGLEGLDDFPIPPGSCAQPGNWYWAYQCIPEIEPPTWWFPFWDDGPSAVDPQTNYRRPEFRVYGWPDGPHYAHEGSKYLVFFGFYGAIDAGIYQQVQNVSPGQPYEFSFQAFAWSNCLDGKEGDSGDGCHDFPDDQAVFKAGIDPTGGTDFTSPNIVWSEGDSIYDAYQRVAVTANAQSTTLTVFVRCTFWHNYIQHNDAHVDALQLIGLAPVIELDTAQLAPASFFGDPAPPPDIFIVRNASGGSTLTYTIADDASWLGISPSAGTSTGEADDITVQYNVTGLEPGEHFATITVTSPDASNSPQSIAVRLAIESVKPDLDFDLDVDQSDFGIFQSCYSGSGIAPAPVCDVCDFDADNDVDGDDFALFNQCVSGSDVQASRNCAD